MHFYKCFFPIIIIRINYCKRLIYNTFTASYRLTGSPRFCTVRRFLKAFRKILQRLEHIFHITNFFNTVSDYLSKIFLNILTDNKYDFIKSCFQRIMDRIINNNFAVRSNRCQLFYATTKTGSDSGCHNH